MKSFLMFYYNGFKSMTLGKTLWKVILIKLFVILAVLKLFVYQDSYKSIYKTNEERSQFVTNNLLKKNSDKN